MTPSQYSLLKIVGIWILSKASPIFAKIPPENTLSDLDRFLNLPGILVPEPDVNPVVAPVPCCCSLNVLYNCSGLE